MSTFGESIYGGVITCRKIIAQEADLPSSGGGGSGGTIEISGINLDNKWSISLDNDSNFYLTNDLVNVVGLSGDAHTGKITLFDFKLDDVEDVDTSIKENGSIMYYNSTLQKYEFTDKVRYLVNSLDISSIPIVTVSGDLRIFGDTSANIFLGGDARTTPTLNGNSIGIGYKACDLNNTEYNIAIGCQAGEIEQGKDFLYFTGEAIAIGRYAGQSNQEAHTIAIGSRAGNSNQEAGAISIGYLAGVTDQSGDSISIGNQAGKTNQDGAAIAIGTLSGLGNQGQGAVSIGESCGYSFQGLKSVAIGSGAGSIRQNEKAIAIGNLCAYTDQSVNSIAIGNEAAKTTQNIECIAIGSFAGNLQQGQGIGSFIGESIAIGKQAGESNQQPHTIAIGSTAGQSNQEIGSISIGYQAGAIDQSGDSISIGNQAGKTRQDRVAIAIGTFAGTNNQKSGAIAIGDSCGYFNQGLKTIAIGSGSGRANQNEKAISIGYFSAYTDQSVNSIAVGNEAGKTTQNIECVAIGSSAGKLQQGKGISSFIGESVAIGKQAGEQNQHAYGIAIGSSAGSSNQQSSALAIGFQAGATDQSSNSVAIGTYAGSVNQKGDAISIGTQAGNSNQGINSIAIGSSSALVTQGSNSVAIGHFSGANTQGNDAVSIGHLSGRASLGSSSIAIGHRASDNGGSFSSTVVLNGTGSDLNPAQANSTYIKPIRSLTQAQTLHYDDGTGEITRANNVSLTNGTGINVTGTYPAFTITNTAGGSTFTNLTATGTIFANTIDRIGNENIQRLGNINSAHITIEHNHPSHTYGSGSAGSWYGGFNGANLFAGSSSFRARSNQCQASHNLTITSDDRFKSRTVNLPDNCLDIINKLQPKKYLKHHGHYVPEGVEDSDLTGVEAINEAGLISQDVEKIPELNWLITEQELGIDTKKYFKAIDYGSLYPYLIKAVQELNECVKSLEAKVKTLESK